MTLGAESPVCTGYCRIPGYFESTMVGRNSPLASPRLRFFTQRFITDQLTADEGSRAPSLYTH